MLEKVDDKHGEAGLRSTDRGMAGRGDGLHTASGISVWLVEVKAVRIGNSEWAPLFTTVVEPNEFVTAVIEDEKKTKLTSLAEFLAACDTAEIRTTVTDVVQQWDAAGHKRRFGPNYVVLEARGPSKRGMRTVVTLYTDGRVFVPFMSYAGWNSGIPVESLTTEQFRREANGLFGFNGSEQQARTTAGWLEPSRIPHLMAFCFQIADAYAEAPAATRTVLAD